ncbi:MAG: hypothetical protein IAG10_27720, partial [Planctomycetaceae bacterium]|nr:hypothetical protein [Planctomycetaceae bacterium]
MWHRRLTVIASVLLTLASWPAFADENDPAQSAPAKTARDQNAAADPDAPPKSDKTEPTSRHPFDAGFDNIDPAASAKPPNPKPEPPAERTARLTKLLRYEINDDTRRILDTTFAYPKNLAQLEANFDKCFDEERYKDGEKVVAELIRQLRERHRSVHLHPSGEQTAYTDHVLLKAWEFEAALCQRAVKQEFGADSSRRRAVAVARLKRVREMAEAWAPGEVGSHRRTVVFEPKGIEVIPTGRPVPVDYFAPTTPPSKVSTEKLADPPNDPSSLAYLLLRASKSEERHPAELDDAITQSVNTMLDRVTVELPVNDEYVPIGSSWFDLGLGGKRMRLRDVPEDALLWLDVPSMPKARSYALAAFAEPAPIRRSQCGTQAAAHVAQQKLMDEVTQKHVQSTLQQLFPSETIEVHVVRSTVILRAALRNAAHEQQIVSIAQSLSGNVLNQMAVNGDDTDRVATVAEKLEPIGDDPHGLREILARLYPKEHIEAHVLTANSAVVLRGHLSRPEYAQQVYDIAVTSYATVLYQMTPPLPPKQQAMRAPSANATTPKDPPPNSSLGVPDSEAGKSATIRMSDWVIIRLSVADVEGAADELRAKFGDRANIRFGPRLDSISVKASPQVIEEVRAAVAKLNGPGTNPDRPAAFNPLAVLMGGGAGTAGVENSGISIQALNVKRAMPTDVREAAMDQEARQLAMKFRTAKLDEQPGLRRQMEQLTERHFEQRQQRRQREIDDLGHRLDKLRVTHHRRQENKAAVVQQRVQDLLDPNADLRWDEPKANEISNLGASSRAGTARQSNDAANPYRGMMEAGAHPAATADATSKVIVIEATPFAERSEVIRKVVEALEKAGIARKVPQDDSLNPPFVGPTADIAARADLEYEAVIQLVNTLKDLGVHKIRFANTNNDKNTVIVVASADVAWRTVRHMTEQLEKHKPFHVDVFVRDNNEPATPTVKPGGSVRPVERRGASGNSATDVEPTFDGTPYSQWLKMLETERKPEKLASAMEACSHLVATGDAIRIVESIFAAARLFDATESDKERSTVWNAANACLLRLLSNDDRKVSEPVVAKLLHDVCEARFAESPSFICQFLVSLPRTNKPLKRLQTHATELVAFLVKHDETATEFDPRLASAATAVWMLSLQPIDDFEGLRPLVLKGYDAHVSGAHYSSTWSAIQTAEYATEVPEIVQILAKHLDKNPGNVVDVLGNLGPAAEPAVPQLVELFVKIWNQREERFREVAAGKASYKSQGDRDFSAQRILLATLKKIGPGAKQAVPLLKELNSIAPHREKDPGRAEIVGFWDELNKTLLAIGDTPDNEPAGSKPLLSEFSHLATTWKLTASRPGQTTPRITLHIGDDFRFGPQGAEPVLDVLELLGCRTSGPNYTIDETTNPKQITLVDRDVKTYQQFLICELKGDRLKIEFAKPGLPRP